METDVEIGSKEEQGTGGTKEMRLGGGSPEMISNYRHRADQKNKTTKEIRSFHDSAYFPDIPGAKNSRKLPETSPRMSPA